MRYDIIGWTFQLVKYLKHKDDPKGFDPDYIPQVPELPPCKMDLESTHENKDISGDT